MQYGIGTKSTMYVEITIRENPENRLAENRS